MWPHGAEFDHPADNWPTASTGAVVKRTTRKFLAVAGIGMLAPGAIAFAHHSVAAFDRAHPTTLSGTVMQYKYTNPHTWIYLMVADDKGGEHQWALEGGTLSMARSQGWTRNALKPGQKLKLLIAPRKDGADGGEWLQILEIDGKTVVIPATTVAPVAPRY
jgi:hypothetical protein